ncbi:MAG: hypothetical protein OEY41_07620 [Acidimicrobiia bacterium]|nr:hypothetical protein [Acidimicrobiia bacterium]
MTEIRDSWRDVAAKAEAIGLKLRLHLEQEDQVGGEPPAESATGGTRAAIDELGTKLKDAIEAFGAAAKDPAVRSDVADMGSLLKDALITTFSAVGADLSEAARGMGDVRRKGGGTPPPPGPADTASDDDASDTTS